jgi:hypothetical protein
MNMNEHTTIYPLSEVEPIIKNASLYALNDAYVWTSEITDDPNDYVDDEQFALAQESFLWISRHDSEWEEVDDTFFPRNRNQEVKVKFDSIFYLYDHFGVEHELIAYSTIRMK